jgi:hypothetical protein
VSQEQTPEPEDMDLTLPASPDIHAVHYQKLVSLGNYENERVGVWAQVREGDTAEQTLQGLRTWVDAQLGQHREVQDLESQLYRLRHEKTALEGSVEHARTNYEKAKAFVEGMGLTMPTQYVHDDEMPW